MIRLVAAMAAFALVTAPVAAQTRAQAAAKDEAAKDRATKDRATEDTAADEAPDEAVGHTLDPIRDEVTDNTARETQRWPITEATSWAVYESQVAPLLADLQFDRASGRQYARAPERGTEATIQDVALAIRNELTAKECWSERDLVVAGRRETIAIAVRFGVDGRFVEEPRLVSPQEMPERDPALRGFIRRTFSALRACNVNGLTLPPKYYEDPVWVYFIVQSRPE